MLQRFMRGAEFAFSALRFLSSRMQRDPGGLVYAAGVLSPDDPESVGPAYGAFQRDVFMRSPALKLTNEALRFNRCARPS
jgi:hypothetical protein